MRRRLLNRLRYDSEYKAKNNLTVLVEADSYNWYL